MSRQSLANEVSNFFIDKQKLEKIVKNLRSGQICNEHLQLAMEIEEKYEEYPSYFRSLQPYFKEFRQLIGVTANQPVSSPAQRALPPHQRALPEESNLPPINLYQIKNTAPVFQPSPDSIGRFFEANGIIGEEKNSELLLYALIAKANVGIESISGSGKSALLYALLKAVPPEMYLVIHQATTKSLYNHPDINKISFLVIPELQKVLNNDIEEIIKNITEGVSATYTKTNSKRNGIDVMEVKEKAVLYSFAVTNKHLKYRDDEFFRRFIILHTDISKQQNKNVAVHLAKKDFSGRSESEYEETTLFKQHIKACLISNPEVKNPFIEYIIKNYPKEISGQVRFRSYGQYLSALIKGATIFNSAQQDELLFSTCKDNLRILELYEKVLVNNIYGLNVLDRGILDLLESQSMSIAQLKEEFREIYGTVLTVEESIEKLAKIEMVKSEQDVLTLYPLPHISFNLEEAINSADKLMKKYEPKYRDQWHDKCLNEINDGGGKIAG